MKIPWIQYHSRDGGRGNGLRDRNHVAYKSMIVKFLGVLKGKGFLANLAKDSHYQEFKQIKPWDHMHIFIHVNFFIHGTGKNVKSPPIKVYAL